jgi:hypothetical protein
MDLTKFDKLLDLYEERLTKLPETTPNFRKRRRVLGMLPTFRHLLGCLAMEGQYTEEQQAILILKLNRWLGFIQAILWDLNLFSIDEFRRHVRGVFKQ